MRPLIAALPVVALLSLAAGADAAQDRTKADRIDVRYVVPKSEALVPIYQRMKDHKVLETARRFLSTLRLPRRLMLKAEGCDGEVNAWYDEDAITICYEFVDDVYRNATTDVAAIPGLLPVDTVIGPIVDVILHEAGHAVFDMLKVPVFGREEDAADQFSAFIVLQFDKQQARRLLLGNAYQYKRDLTPAGPAPALTSFANVHGTPAQRFFNVLCIGYGADPRLFADVVEKGFLPQDRAEDCEAEYRQVAYAFEQLIGPHLDRRRAARLFKRAWLPPGEETKARGRR